MVSGLCRVVLCRVEAIKQMETGESCCGDASDGVGP